MDWAHILIAANTIFGIAIIVTLLHVMVGRNGYTYLAVIIAMAVLGSTGATKVFYFYNAYPVLGGSLYMPALFCLLMLSSYELSDKVTRLIMACSILSLAVMSLGNARWLLFEIILPEATTFEYSTRVSRVSVLFVACVIIYFAVNARLVAQRTGFMNSVPERFIFTSVILMLTTFVQLVAYHKELVDANPELVLYTLFLRLLVVVVFAGTYYYRFSGNPPVHIGKRHTHS